MNMLGIMNEIRESKKNIKIRDFYEKVLRIRNRNEGLRSIIDIDCTKVLKKNVPKNFILSNDDAIKLIEYKLIKANKSFIMEANFSEEILDRILTREVPLEEVYSVYDNTIGRKNEKIEKANKRIKELQDYVSIMKQIGGDLIG